MKLRLLLPVVAAMVCTVAMAQRIQVVDTDGMPIPTVCVTDENGALVGTTDYDGWLEDAKGKTPLYFSHLAFQDRCVALTDIVNSQVVLEDFKYELGDVVVKPKELLYLQTYYRCIYVCDEGPIYFRAGVMDNTFEFAKKKITSKSKSVSRGKNGFYRFLLSTLAGRYVDNWAKLDTLSTYNRLLKAVDKGKLAFSDTISGRCLVSDTISVLGYIEDDIDAKLKTTSFDFYTYNDRLDAAKEKEKEEKELEKNKGKEKKKDKKKKKKDRAGEHGYYEVYRFDDDGNSTYADMVMKQLLVKGHMERTDQDYIILLEVFNTGHSYIDKKEFKNTRKENEVEMDILELRQFEQAHNIPDLAPNLKAAVDKLFEKDLKKKQR